MKAFKQCALEKYDMVQHVGGSHCAILVLKKDK